jgi:hypothetical protein
MMVTPAWTWLAAILVALCCTAGLAAEIDYVALGRNLKVKPGHPILFLDADLLAKIRARPQNCRDLEHTVTQYRTRRAKNPGEVETIRQEIAQFNDRTHPGEYLQTSMWYAADALINQDELSAAYGREYLKAIADLEVASAKDGECHALGSAFACGVLYDYLYPTLDENLKHRTRLAVIEAGEALAGWHYLDLNMYLGGHGACWAVPYLLVGLLGIHSDMAREPEEVQTRYYDLLGKVVYNVREGLAPVREWICKDGGYHMGWDYGSCYTTMIPYLAWEYGTDEPSLLKDWQNQMTMWYLYGLRQQAQVTYRDKPELVRRAYQIYPPSGDCYSGPQLGGDPAEALLVGACKYDNPYAKWLLNRYRPAGADATAWQEVLYRQFDAGAGTPPDALPLSRNFPNAGSVIMRDSWDPDRDTQVVFKSAPFFSNNHHHRDQNSFVIYYKAPLAIDSGGYNLCGAYGSRHWYNYYIRSVAHNTILVYDPKEDFGESRWGKNSNDGGQAMWPFGAETGKLEDILPGGRCALDGLGRFEERPEYTYTLGDATKAYSPGKVRTCQRQLVYLRNHSYGHPVIVVYDKVVSKDPAFKKTYLLHSIGEPNVSGKTFWTEGSDGLDPGNRARLYDEVILPADATLSAVGGVKNGQEFYVADDGTGQPHNYSEEFAKAYPREAALEPSERERGDMRELGGWRVEVSPAGQRLDDRFLNVLSVTDGGDQYQAAMTKYQGGDLFDAVTVTSHDGEQSTLVFFWRDNAAFTDVTLATGSCRQMLMVGLHPGAALGVDAQGANVKLTRRAASAGQRVRATEQGTVFVKLR